MKKLIVIACLLVVAALIWLRPAPAPKPETAVLIEAIKTPSLIADKTLTRVKPAAHVDPFAGLPGGPENEPVGILVTETVPTPLPPGYFTEPNAEMIALLTNTSIPRWERESGLPMTEEQKAQARALEDYWYFLHRGTNVNPEADNSPSWRRHWSAFPAPQEARAP